MGKNWTDKARADIARSQGQAMTQTSEKPAQKWTDRARADIKSGGTVKAGPSAAVDVSAVLVPLMAKKVAESPFTPIVARQMARPSTQAKTQLETAQKELERARDEREKAVGEVRKVEPGSYLMGRGNGKPGGVPYAAGQQAEQQREDHSYAVQLSETDRAMKEARWKVRDMEDAYAAALAQEKAVKLPSDPETLKKMHQQAVEEEQAAAKAARQVPAGAYAERGIATAAGGSPYAAGPSGVRTPEQEAELERQRELAAKQDRVDTLAAAHYNAENQKNLGRLQKDTTAGDTYRTTLELKTDLDKLSAVLNPPTTYNGMASRGDSYRRELAAKYGEEDMEKLRGILAERYQAGVKALSDGGYDAEKLAEYERRQRSQERAQQAREESKQFAREHPVLSSVGTVLAAPGQGVEFVRTALSEVGHSDPYDLDTYRPLDTSDMYLTNFNQTVRGEVSRDLEDNWGPVGSFAYQTGMSMADFLFTSAVTGNFAGGGAVSSNLALGIMGSSAAANTTMDAVNRGLSNRQAIALGVIAGAAEVLTENVSLETLLDKTSMGRSRFGYFLQNVAAEGSEEAASDVINWVADILVSGNKAEWWQAIERYREQGENEHQAFIHALTDKAQEIGLDALGGAVSGGVMAGGNILLSSKATGSGVEGRVTADGGVDTPTGDLALNREKSGIAGGEESPVVMPLIDAQKTASTSEVASFDVDMVAQDVVDRYVDHSISKSRFVDNPLITDESVADLSLGKASDALISKIWNEYGIDIHGKNHVLTDNDVRHMYNSHGPHTPEALPVTAADIKMIPTIIGHPDDVYYLPRKDGKVGLMYRYRHNGTTFFLEQIIGDTLKSKQMIKVPTGTIPDVEGLADAIKAKSTGSLPSDAAGAVPQMYVQDVRSDAFLDSSVSQTPPDVNPEGGDGAPNSVGAAARGFEAPGTGGTRESRLAQTSMGWNRVRGEASLYDRAQWDESMRYEPQSEQQSLQYARDMVYREVGGEQVCVFDLDPASFEDLYQTYSAAPAWDGVMTDVGHMVEMELLRRTVAGAESNENYNRWVQLCKDKAGKTGQGVQAHDKWSRRLGECAASGEKEAWEALRQMDMPEEERQRRFSTIVSFDTRIEAAKDAAQLQEIILDIARERGTLNRALSGKESARMTRLVEKALSGLDEAELKRFAYASSAALVKDLTPADAGEMMKTIQVLNMLSNPKTAMRNLVGNTTFYALDAMTMRVGAILDMVLANSTGTRSIAMEPSALSQESRAAILKALKRSVAEITLDVDMEGGNRYQRSGRRTFRASGGIAERVLSALERNMGYLMTTTDEGYKGAARATQAATQRLVDQGKIKTSNPDYAKDQADTLAKYRTFQGDSAVAGAIQAIHDVLNMIPLFPKYGKVIGKKQSHISFGGLGDVALTTNKFGLGDLVAPFTGVAGNLVQVGIDYSPAKVVNGIKEIVEVVAAAHNGKTVDPAKQAKGVSDFTRGMTGTMLATGFMLLAAKGAIRRAEDEGDEDVAARNKAAGMVGTQVNLSVLQRVVSGGSWAWQDGDILVDLSSIEPLNYIVDMGAELAKLQNEGNIVTRYAKATMNSATHAAEDLPVMETVSGLAKDIMVYHKDAGPAALERLGKTVISSVTPNVFAAAAKALDDKQRSTYSSAERGLQRSVDILLDTAKSRTPVLRETLPTAVGPDGAEKENPGSLAERLINAMVNPFGVNTYTQSEEGREMDRVRSETGETDFYPASTIPSSISYTKDGVTHAKDLDYAQRQAFQKTRSTAHLVAISGMMGTKEYQKADVETQAALLKLCYDYAYGQAKAEVLGEEAAPAWVSHAQAAQKELGISTAEYLYYYETLGGDIMSGSGYDKTCRMVKAGVKLEDWAKMRKATDADGSGSTTKAELTAYIDKHFPAGRRSKVFDAYVGKSGWKNPY